MAPATNAKTAAEPPAAAKTRIQNRFPQGHVRRAPDSLGLRLPAEIIGNLSALSGALATRLNRLPRTQACCLQKSCHFAVPEANFMGAIARLDVNAFFFTPMDRKTMIAFRGRGEVSRLRDRGQLFVFLTPQNKFSVSAKKLISARTEFLGWSLKLNQTHPHYPPECRRN
jgi:hypothetical protein